ncbi:hypothetical protein D9615_010666 [Tricholomella constricta]|uniref:Uncharacterized protein n=1 Tax=Tricholomella constricta TaxID=117010 RepID=A0A8H5GK50_9AGAR|nr:hypothetical protein D9615_010666 [Tricholomella constricta]
MRLYRYEISQVPSPPPTADATLHHPSLHFHVPIASDIIPAHTTCEQLHRHAQDWRGSTALSPFPPPPPNVLITLHCTLPRLAVHTTTPSHRPPLSHPTSAPSPQRRLPRRPAHHFALDSGNHAFFVRSRCLLNALLRPIVLCPRRRTRPRQSFLPSSATQTQKRPTKPEIVANGCRTRGRYHPRRRIRITQPQAHELAAISIGRDREGRAREERERNSTCWWEHIAGGGSGHHGRRWGAVGMGEEAIRRPRTATRSDQKTEMGIKMPPKVRKRCIQREEEALTEAVGAAWGAPTPELAPEPAREQTPSPLLPEIEIEIEVAIPAGLDDISSSSRCSIAATSRHSRDTDTAAHACGRLHRHYFPSHFFPEHHFPHHSGFFVLIIALNV